MWVKDQQVRFQFYEVIVRVPLYKPLNWYMLSPEAVVQRCSVKKLLLKFQACNFIEKKDSSTGVFLWIFWNF